MAKKFYAVAIGHKPGIYNSWDECEAQVKGFKKAKFKSFPSLEKAKEFIEANAQKEEEKPQAENKKQKKVDDFFESDGTATKKVKKIVESNIHITVFFDGGSRGNGAIRYPVAGSGAILQITDKEKHEVKTIKLREFLDERHLQRVETLSNNFAEYMALIVALKEIKKENLVAEGVKLSIYGDSSLVINQLSGTYACRAENIHRLYKEAKQIIAEFESEGMIIELTHVLREGNSVADALANAAMDQKRSWSTSSVEQQADTSNKKNAPGSQITPGSSLKVRDV